MTFFILVVRFAMDGLLTFLVAHILFATFSCGLVEVMYVSSTVQILENVL